MQTTNTSIQFLILAGFMGYIGSLCHSLPTIIMNYIIYIFSYSRRVNSDDDTFGYMLFYYSLYSKIKNTNYIKHLGSPVSIPFTVYRYSEKYISNSKTVLEILKDEDLSELKRKKFDDDFDDFTLFDSYKPFPLGTYWVYLGKLTFMKITARETIKTNVNQSSNFIPTNMLSSKELSINVIGLCAKSIIDEIKETGFKINKEINDMLINNTLSSNGGNLSFTIINGEMGKVNIIPKRFKESIFLDNIDEIFDSIKKHTSKKKYNLCKKLGMNFKCNVLLYGKPGTGKTSLLKAIASELTVEGEVLMLDSNSNLISEGYHSEYKTRDGKFKSVNFIEEIDLVLNKRGENELKKDSKEVLKGYLEFLDGPLTPPSLFTIATTNHIENLDPAIIRRFDLVFEIGELDKNLAKEMTRYYDLDENLIDEWYSDDTKINQSELSRKLMLHLEKEL